MADDACTKEVKRRYRVWPSARASQAVARCRKRKGKWVDKKTGKPCGHSGDSKSQYCRPSKVVSKKKTPSTRATKTEVQDALFRKRAGKRAASKPTPRRER
jgi:hypothetical protein